MVPKVNIVVFDLNGILIDSIVDIELATHQDHLLAVLNPLKYENANAVMIGDSEIDLICAHQAGIPFIGVSYGYGNLPACHLIHHFSELSNAIGNLNTYA